MYAFRELDNLEYSIAKYRIGFMSRDDPQTKFVLCRIMFQLGYTVCGDGRRPFHTLSRTAE